MQFQIQEYQNSRHRGGVGSLMTLPEILTRHGEPRRGVAIQHHRPLDGHGAARLAMTKKELETT